MAKAKNPGSRSKKNGDVSIPSTLTTTSENPGVEVRPENKERKIVAEPRRNIVPINLEEEIRRRAYEIYEERGRTPGNPSEDWLLAEREIMTRYNVQRQHSA